MTKYVELNAVLDAIGNQQDGTGMTFEALSHAMRDVMSLPQVDAVPVRHGHYVGEGDGYANGELVYDVWKCSECGCVFEDEYEKPTYNYCPNCGADMRGDNSENE